MVRIAHFGCGYWGRNLARNLSELGYLAAVADTRPLAAEEMARTLGSVVRDPEDILADSSIDAITIATPAETHAKLGSEALRRGKHVFVEKPLSLSEVDSEALIKAAAAAGRQLMVGHLLQYHPVFIEMKRMVEEGRIGRLQYVYSNRLSLGKFRVEEDVLWSFAPHDVSMILALAGGEPSTVSAQGASFCTPGICDWTTVQMRFANGISGHVEVSWLHPFKEQRLVAIGSEGMLVFEDSLADWDRKLAFYPHRIDRTGAVPNPQKADAQFVFVEKSEPLKEELRHFASCIAENRRPRTDGLEGLAVQRVLTQASQQLKSYLAG